MSGSSFGEIFKVTTFGESHGIGLGVIIDGVPPNVEITEEIIQKELDRRKPGQSSITTQRKEDDKLEILSGIFEGKTTGTPIGVIVRNQDQRSKDYSKIKDIMRPGHADYTYWKKYGIRDYRGGGRSSGRETLCRVIAGAIAKEILKQKGIKIIAYTKSIADIECQTIDYQVIEKNKVRAADLKAADKMVQEIERARKNLNSVGGVIHAVIQGMPVGIGEPVFDKLTARLSYAIMSIATTRGIEFGAGFKAARMTGQEHNDEFYKDEDGRVRTKTNNAGGILGGITNGEDITLNVAIKPTSSLAIKQDTIDTNNQETKVETKGRHDPCICPRVVPVIESMIAITLVDMIMQDQSRKIYN